MLLLMSCMGRSIVKSEEMFDLPSVIFVGQVLLKPYICMGRS